MASPLMMTLEIKLTFARTIPPAIWARSLGDKVGVVGMTIPPSSLFGGHLAQNFEALGISLSCEQQQQQQQHHLFIHVAPRSTEDSLKRVRAAKISTGKLVHLK